MSRVRDAMVTVMAAATAAAAEARCLTLSNCEVCSTLESACTVCEDGYRLENNVCVERMPAGILAAIIIGSILATLLIILAIVYGSGDTCCGSNEEEVSNLVAGDNAKTSDHRTIPVARAVN